LRTLILSLALLAAAIDPARGATIDDFDDNAIDASLWSLNNPGSGVTVQEINQRLEISFAADAAGAFGGGYWSKASYSGDVDISVSFSLLDWPAKNGVRVGLSFVTDPTPRVVPTAFWAMERASGGPTELYSDVYVTDFNRSIGTLVSTADTSGGLRIAREGDTISAWYLVNGSWQLARSEVVASAGPLYVTFAAWSDDQFFADQPVKVAFDNVVAAPEPVTSALLLFGLGLLAARRRSIR
jgi:hypothetical protein